MTAPLSGHALDDGAAAAADMDVVPVKRMLAVICGVAPSCRYRLRKSPTKAMGRGCVHVQTISIAYRQEPPHQA